MAANTFVHTVESTEYAECALEDFLAQAVADAPFEDYEAGIYVYCQCAPEGELPRRVLVVCDKYTQPVRVCIEAAYELFQGDIHYHVKRINTVNRENVRIELEPLIRRAFAELMAWKPTHENIWDYVF
jgi:hypothetical protein